MGASEAGSLFIFTPQLQRSAVLVANTRAETLKAPALLNAAAVVMDTGDGGLERTRSISRGAVSQSAAERWKRDVAFVRKQRLELLSNSRVSGER